jgi:hypothetical protein
LTTTIISSFLKTRTGERKSIRGIKGKRKSGCQMKKREERPGGLPSLYLMSMII